MIARCDYADFTRAAAEDAPRPQDAHAFARQIATLKTVQGDSRPFMVMDVQRVEELLAEWPKHLPRVQPFYSLECNADAVLLRLLAAHPTVGGFHCTTRAAAERALAHLPPSQLLYANACWTRSSLEEAKRRQLSLLAFERASELERIAFAHPQAELLLNVNVNGDAADEEDPLAQMGCPLAEAPELLRFAADIGARVAGVAFHVGAGACFAEAIRSARQLFDVGARCGLPLSVLNVGDALPASGAAFRRVAAEISAALDAHFPRHAFPQPVRVVATPGRFFAQPAFSLATSVVGRRSVDASLVTGDDFDSGAEAFVYETNDGYYGSFGCRIAGCEPQCTPLFGGGGGEEHAFGTVMGPCMDRFDVLQPVCHFRPLAVGDWLLWPDMGAYTLGNCGSLDEEEGEGEAPTIFHLSKAGSPLSRQPFLVEKEPSLGCEESDDDGAGSCGQSSSLSTLGEEDSFRCESADMAPEQFGDAPVVEDSILGWLLQLHRQQQ